MMVLEDYFPLPGGPYSQVPAVNLPGALGSFRITRQARVKSQEFNLLNKYMRARSRFLVRGHEWSHTHTTSTSTTIVYQ